MSARDGFEDSEIFEERLSKFVFEMDLPLCLSRVAHIAWWKHTYDYDWAEDEYVEQVHDAWREG